MIGDNAGRSRRADADSDSGTVDAPALTGKRRARSLLLMAAACLIVGVAWAMSPLGGDSDEGAAIVAQAHAQTSKAKAKSGKKGKAKPPAEAKEGDTAKEGDAAQEAPGASTEPALAPVDPNAPNRLPLGAEAQSRSFECKSVREDPGAPQHAKALAPFTEEMYPCTGCHDQPNDFNKTQRNLTLQHLDIELHHGPREQWCYDCHSPTHRDKLQFAGDRLIGFEQSYELCGQCHGSRLKDWRAGIHGRRTGCWNGEREYLVCVQCHDPHAPAFKPMAPKPPPKKPTEIRLPASEAGGER